MPVIKYSAMTSDGYCSAKLPRSLQEVVVLDISVSHSVRVKRSCIPAWVFAHHRCDHLIVWASQWSRITNELWQLLRCRMCGEVAPETSGKDTMGAVQTGWEREKDALLRFLRRTLQRAAVPNIGNHSMLIEYPTTQVFHGERQPLAEMSWFVLVDHYWISLTK